MVRDISMAADNEWPEGRLSKDSTPRREGFLPVSHTPPHKIYWHEYGNPDGEPIILIHGGPGAHTSPADARFFDPKRYRIILFDQRGCGKSKPSAAEDPKAALNANNTDNLIGDIETLRDHLRIRGKAHIFGGSWGSTLALAYAMVHPEHVKSLTLRGIFLSRHQDLNYLQGNAATYPLGEQPGAYRFNPWGEEFLKCIPPEKREPLRRTLEKAWGDFVQIIPPGEKRKDMVKAYGEIFENEKDDAKLTKAVQAWSVWEGLASFLSPDISDVSKTFGDPKFAKAFCQVERHYFMNGSFLGGKGEANRDNNFLLDNAGAMLAGHGIHVDIVQGKFDRVCPRDQADALAKSLKEHGIPVHYRLTDAGHSALEFENMKALCEATDKLPPLEEKDKAVVSSGSRAR